jgi:hypothetical protein
LAYPIRPSLSRTTTPSLVVSTISRKRSSLARRVASAACRSRRSSKTAAPRTSAGNRPRRVQYQTASSAVMVSQPAAWKSMPKAIRMAIPACMSPPKYGISKCTVCEPWCTAQLKKMDAVASPSGLLRH